MHIQRYNKEVFKKVKYINALLKLFIHEKKAQMPVDITGIREILIVEISLIGDEIMTIPFYANLKANCPNARITVIGRNWISKQLMNQGLVDELIEFDGFKCLSSPIDWLKYRKAIHDTVSTVNKKHYDVCFEPRGDIRYALFMHFMNSERKISFNLMGNDYMMTDPIEEDDRIIHEIPHRLSLLQKVGFDLNLSNGYPVLKTTESQVAFNSVFLKQHRIEEKCRIGIHPGASLKDKMYPYYPKVVSEVIDHLENKQKYSFLVFCGKGERETAEEVRTAITNKGVTGVVVEEGLENYIGLISVCDYMVCNDSGAGHIAAAFGIPVTVVFGPVLAEMYAPIGENKVYCISHALDCKPCQKRECPQKNAICLTGIATEEVSDTIMRMIQASPCKQ